MKGICYDDIPIIQMIVTRIFEIIPKADMPRSIHALVNRT